MRFTDGRVFRFLVAGSVNTAITYIAYLLLLQVSAYRVAFTVSFVFGILVSYILSARFVFRRPASRRSFLQFPLVYAAQYLLGLLLVTICVEQLGMPSWLAPLTALAVTIPITYLLSRQLFVGGGHP